MKLVKRFSIQGSNSEMDDLYITKYVVIYSEFDVGYWRIFDIPTIGALVCLYLYQHNVIHV